MTGHCEHSDETSLFKRGKTLCVSEHLPYSYFMLCSLLFYCLCESTVLIIMLILLPLTMCSAPLMFYVSFIFCNNIFYQ